METEQSLFITEILEKSAPFLNECKFIEILADNEISKIISTRTDFEYKLLSTNKELDIYLRYLQFELNLLLLVSTRKKKKSLKHINRFGDYLNHVSFVFKRGLAIYRNEIKLWKAFIDFAVQYQYKTEQAFEDAVKMNPTNADIWILCAKWHAEFNNNPESARNIFRRGVKLIKENGSLWYEFFKLEMILAIQNTETVDVPEQDIKYDYDVPKLIYGEIQQAKALRFNHQLRFAILELLANYPKTSEMQNTILADTLENFRHDEFVIYKCLSWRWQAYGAGETQVYNALKQATEAIPTPKMWQYFAQFTKDCYNRATSKKDKQKLLKQLNEIYAEANDRNLISPVMLHDWISILTAVGINANNLVKQACTAFPNDVPLWILNIELNHTKEVVDKAIASRNTSIVLETEEEKENFEKSRTEFWNVVLDFVEKTPECKADQYYVKALKECGNGVKLRYIEWSIAHGDVNKCIDTVFAFSPNSEQIYRYVLKFYGKDWEGNFDRLVKLYQKATAEHGTTCEDFWIGQIILMKRRGELKRVHNLYYQAMKTLKSTDRFTEKYDLIK